MVYEQAHGLCRLHEAEEAIRKGTLFGELYMPMKGECADSCGAQLCDGQAEAFAAWELRLYLNTHPCDRRALELFKRYARCADQPNYAGAFAFDDGCPDRWSWTDAPWPWEHNAACEDTCGC
jgi:spore coat protein JB